MLKEDWEFFKQKKFIEEQVRTNIHTECTVIVIL